MRILREFLGDEASNDRGQSKTSIFSAFGRSVFGILGNEGNFIT